MIPLDRVRALLSAMHSTDLQELAREEPDWTDLCAEAGPVDLFIAAPDLARDVLSLAGALATAERERDYWRTQATAAAPCVDAVRALTLRLIPGGTGCAVDPERVVAAVDELRAECDRIDAAASRADAAGLRAIVDGRATAPTEAELVAHIAAGGRWLVSSPGEPDVPLWSMPVASVEHGLRVAQDHHDLNAPWRWHALLDGRPCPWPTPALGATGEGR